jgi:hypothetical protein
MIYDKILLIVTIIIMDIVINYLIVYEKLKVF